MAPILVVEDHRVVAEGLGMVLGGAHPHVGVEYAHSVPTALQRLGADEPLSLVLLDLSLGAHSGEDVLRSMHATDKRVPTLVLSGAVSGDVVERCRALGALAVIDKREGASVLLEAVAGVLGDTRSSSRTSDPCLTDRQLEVLHLLAGGSSNRELAEKLNVSRETIKSHLSAIYAAMEVRGRVSCVVKARHLGLL